MAASGSKPTALVRGEFIARCRSHLPRLLQEAFRVREAKDCSGADIIVPIPGSGSLGVSVLHMADVADSGAIVATSERLLRSMTSLRHTIVVMMPDAYSIVDAVLALQLRLGMAGVIELSPTPERVIETIIDFCDALNREKMEKVTADETTSDFMIQEVLTKIPGCTLSSDEATYLLDAYGSLAEISRAEWEDVCSKTPLTPAKAQQLEDFWANEYSLD